MRLFDLISLMPPFELGDENNVMISPSLIIATMLIENLSIGTLPTAEGDLPVYVSHEPDKPNECLTVYDTFGIDEIPGMKGDIVTHHGIQIRVRGRNYNTIWQRMNTVNTAFAAIDDETVDIDGNDITVNAITSTSSIIPLGPTSPKVRDVFVKNFIVTITND